MEFRHSETDKSLACISKMLKAEIDGEGIPTKGVSTRRNTVAITYPILF